MPVYVKRIEAILFSQFPDAIVHFSPSPGSTAYQLYFHVLLCGINVLLITLNMPDVQK